MVHTVLHPCWHGARGVQTIDNRNHEQFEFKCFISMGCSAKRLDHVKFKWTSLCVRIFEFEFHLQQRTVDAFAYAVRLSDHSLALKKIIFVRHSIECQDNENLMLSEFNYTNLQTVTFVRFHFILSFRSVLLAIYWVFVLSYLRHFMTTLHIRHSYKLSA